MSGRRRKIFVVVSISLLLLAGIVFGAAFLSEYHPEKSQDAYSLIAEQSGNLTQGDPVKFNGVKVGKVGQLQLDSAGKVRISILIESGLRIPVGSVVRIRCVGLMGERMIAVDLSSSRESIPVGGVLAAAFEPGFSDTLVSTTDAIQDIRKSLESIQKDLHLVARNSGVHPDSGKVQIHHRQDATVGEK